MKKKIDCDIENEFFFISDIETKESCGSANGLSELAKFLHRTKKSILESLYELKNKRKRDIILVDNKGREYLIMCGQELDGGKWTSLLKSKE